MLSACVGALGLVSTASANEFDNCVLQHMTGVQSDVAAKEVKIACVSVTEHVIADGDMLFVKAKAFFSDKAYISLGPSYTKGLVIEFFNDTPYDISGLKVKVTDKNGVTQRFELGHPFHLVGSVYTPAVVS
jgi:hypothetical protein